MTPFGATLAREAIHALSTMAVGFACCRLVTRTIAFWGTKMLTFLAVESNFAAISAFTLLVAFGILARLRTF